MKEVNKACSDAAKEAQFNTMYYITAEPVLPFFVTPDPEQDKKKLYSSERAKSEILDTINATLEEKVVCDIDNSEFIGLITDVTVHKKLNVYVKCLDEKSEFVIYFVDCINVVDGKPETIVS